MSRSPVKHEIHSARPQFPTRGERVDIPPTSARSICLAIGEPVRVCEIDDGDGRTLIVEPLHFFKPYRRGDSTVVKRTPESVGHLFHAAATGEQITPSQAGIT